MGIQDMFSSEDPYVLPSLIVTARTNQADLNVVIQETDYLQATSVAQQQQGLTSNTANPVPNVTIVAQQTIGSAIARGAIDDDGRPCFIGGTAISADGVDICIRDIQVKDWVMAFTPNGGVREMKMVTGKYEHWVESYMLVEFEDGQCTGVDANGDHKYWAQNGIYAPIRGMEAVWHWSDGWKPRKVVRRTVINEPTMLYNITVADHHNYIANGDAVSNVKDFNFEE